MVHFHHEERQTGTRRVDMSALPDVRGFIGETYHTIYDPFLVFEGKRLPAPVVSREREYVRGYGQIGWNSAIQAGLHGAQQATAAMIGYIQKNDPKSWHTSINKWIDDVARDVSAIAEEWFVDEQLGDLAADEALRIATSSSLHRRTATAISRQIYIRHLWVIMSD